MKQQSLKVNALLNLIRTLMTIIFPLITFPYASRILLPSGIGKVNFATSIVSYFALIASLGISSYGIREGAKLRDDKTCLSKFAKEIFVINLASTIVAYLLLFISIIFIHKLNINKEIILVCSSTILFTTLGFEWLYTAVEDFTYITIRSICFQIISLVLLFSFVKTKDDVLKYAAISVISSVGSNIFNFIHSKKYICFRNIGIKFTNLRQHFKPVMILFIMAITSSIYTILDTSMLGFMTSNYQVGIYTAATKVNRIVLNLVVSVGTVLLPRLSYYYGNNNKEMFMKLAYRSVDLLMLLAIPAAIGLSVLGNEVIYVISGVDYMDAVPVMRVINPIIIIVGLSNFIGVQIFMPLKKEKWTLYSDIAGASINLIINFMLIPKFGALGAAIGSLCAETTVTVVQLFLVRRYLSGMILIKKIIKYLIMGTIMGVIVFLIKNSIDSYFFSLILSIIVGIIVYGVLLILTRNEWITLLYNDVREKCKHVKERHSKI